MKKIENFLANNIVIILILSLGFFLRSVDIANNPPSLYGDELTLVYDSYSILKTGHDQLGNFLPLTFPMGAGRPGGYIYFSLPFVALFGPSALGVRSLSILSGFLVILLIFLIGKKMFSKSVGLAAAFLAAVSPWDVALSRGGFEAHFALALALGGVYCFLLARTKPIFYILSAIFFGLTLHTYPTYKLVLLLFIPVLIMLERAWGYWLNKQHRGYLLVSIIAFVIFIGVSAGQTFTGGSEARFASINVFSQQEIAQNIEQKINYERTITKLPTFFIQAFHNKYVEYSKVLIENYFKNLSLDFLVIHGDRNPRHNMATMGEIYLVELVLIFYGIVSLWIGKKRELTFLLGWAALAPLGSALLADPHALRSAFMLPAILLIGGYGLVGILEKRLYFVTAAVVIGFVIQFSFFAQKIYFLAPYEYSHFWSYNAKAASILAAQNKDKYDYIFLSDKIDNIEYAYPVYTSASPQVIISQNTERTELAGLKFKQISNVYIGHIPTSEVNKVLNLLQGNALYIGDSTEKKELFNYQTVKNEPYNFELVIIEN